MTADVLFSPYKMGSRTLKNRVVLAPMTRCRSDNGVPTEVMPTYYQQRSEAGLLVTEGTAPSPNGLGYARIPGLYNQLQVEAWKKVTAAVHLKGSAIFVQLMHVGRVGHPANLPAGAVLLAPSAVAAPGQMYTDSQGMQNHPVPLAMSELQIEAAIQEYVTSAQLAIEAGFDGVELHGANGYLIDQFLNTASNKRTDGWGGSVDNRIRFAVEVTRRVVSQIGAERVGLRLSPYGVFNGTVSDAEMDDVYLRLTAQLSSIGLAYVHVLDHSSMGAPKPKESLIRQMRANFKGTFILCGGYDAERATADVLENRGDLIAFGKPFVANPQLVTKLKSGAPLVAPNPATFYTPGPEGYIDYPVEG